MNTEDKEFILPDNSCNNTDYEKVEIKSFSKLQKIRIGKNCFASVKKIHIAKCNNLEDIIIVFHIDFYFTCTNR